MNFYKHWIGDYQRDTADLSLVEHGAYRLLLDAYYATSGLIGTDYGRLYRIARAYSEEEQQAVRTVADRFFPIDGNGGRRNRRADREIAETRDYAEAQRQRANRRWNAKNGQNDAGADATAYATAYARASDDAGAMPTHMPTHMPEEYPNDASHSHSHSHSQKPIADSHSRGGGRRGTTATPSQTPEILAHAPEELPGHYRLAYGALRETAANPSGFDATIRAELQGMHGKAWSGEDVGQALLEMWGNGKTWHAGLFRGYLQKHGRAQERNAALDAEAATKAKAKSQSLIPEEWRRKAEVEFGRAAGGAA